LSGDEKSRAGDPFNGPAAGSGYVLWSERKVNSAACGKIKTPGSEGEENRRRLKGLRCMAG
jgi:hypothetical protein